ncbi:MAG TPA: alpha/beta hydrolase, partial [Ramlibacter sp.]|nr:alpha/beta hydrolase [Ramlibacter sp.]
MSSDTPLPPLETDLPPEALRVLARSRRLATPCGDGELVVHAWGDERHPPLVLLHGGSGSWAHWIRNVEALAAAGRYVVVPDLPGFGDSARPPNGQDADAVAPAVAEALRQLLGERAVDVAGFSFGGLTGVLMAAGQPERVKHLVLIGAPGLGLRDKRLTLTPWRGVEDAEKRLAAHRKNLATLMLHKDEAIDDLAIAVQAANVPRDRMHRRKLAMTDIVARTLPTLACPVDVIYGEKDALYVDTIGEIHGKVSVAPKFGELVFIPGAGHWVQYEAPRELERELLRVLA